MLLKQNDMALFTLKALLSSTEKILQVPLFTFFIIGDLINWANLNKNFNSIWLLGLIKYFRIIVSVFGGGQ